MKIVSPDFNINGSVTLEIGETVQPQHLGWVWLVKMREGQEEAEDAWLADDPHDAIKQAQERYPDAVLVSVHRRDEWRTDSMFRFLLDGRVLAI